MGLWTHAIGSINSILIQPLYIFQTPWIVFSPVLTEGSISLLITLSTGVSLACFLYIYKNLSVLKVLPGTIQEELMQMEMAHLIFSGNLIVGTKRIADASKILAFGKWIRFASRLLFPFLVWTSVSLLSGLCQMSVHSVILTRITTMKAQVRVAHVSDLMTGQHVFLNEGQVSLHNPNVAQSIIQGQTYHSDGFFLANDTLCGGILDPELSFTTRCIMDDTECANVPFSIGPGFLTNIFVNNSSLLASGMRYTLAGGADVFDAGVVPWSTGMDLTRNKDKSERTGYYVGLSGWALGAQSMALDQRNTIQNLVGYISSARQNLNFSAWAGICTHSVKICDATIDGGKILLGDCQSSHFIIPMREIFGIGPALRNHFTFRSGLSTLAASFLNLNGSVNGSLLVHKTLGLLSFAWNLSLQKLGDVPSNDVPAVRTKIEVEDAVAVDFLSTMVLLIFFAISISGALWIWTRSRDSSRAILVAQRKTQWDPMTRLASELSQKHGLDFDHGCWQLSIPQGFRKRPSRVEDYVVFVDA